MCEATPNVYRFSMVRSFANTSQRSSSSANGQSQPRRSARVAPDDSIPTKKSGASSGSGPKRAQTSGGSKLMSTRAQQSPNASVVGEASAKSGRGHDFDGGGIGVANGQLEQAKDRNFDAVFERCRSAATSVQALEPATCIAEVEAVKSLREPRSRRPPPPKLGWG